MKTNLLAAAAIAAFCSAPVLAGGGAHNNTTSGASASVEAADAAKAEVETDAAITSGAAAEVQPAKAAMPANAPMPATTSATADTNITSGAGAEVEAAKPTVDIVSRGADGRPDVVTVDGQTYKVCKGEVEDGCINPRSAGLNFGARDLQYWPGRPASEISTPLPATPPANEPI